MGMYFRTELRPQQWPVPFKAIVTEWMAAKLEPVACRRVVERALFEGMPEGLVDPEQVTRGGVVATERLLHGTRVRDPWEWLIVTPDSRHTFEVAVDMLPTIGELVRIASRSVSRAQAIDQARQHVEDEAVLALFGSAVGHSSEHGTWRPIDRPGIYRREHATLAIRTPGGTTMVTDPQRMAVGWTTVGGAYPADPQWADAHVLITHAHDDHFDIPSILSYATSQSRLLVPHVPAPNILTDDMAALLACVDQKAETPRWWDVVTLGDARVTVLPFYGEQPTRALPIPCGLRMWGHCHRVDTHDWSLLLLCDSGVDPDGSMVDVVRRSVAEQGPVDVVISNCLTFPEMLNVGLAHYSFVIPFDELRANAATRASTTNGPHGVAAACRAAGARYYLPYAQGFRGINQEPISPEHTHSEQEALTEVRRQLARHACSTEVIPWLPGDLLTWEHGRPTLVRSTA